MADTSNNPTSLPEKRLTEQQANLVLNTIGEGFCLIDQGGRILWCNEHLHTFPREVLDRLKQTCISSLAAFAHQPVAESGEAGPRRARGKKFGFQITEDRYYEALISPILQGETVTQVAAIVWDASNNRRLKQRIDAIDAAGAELVRLEGEAIAKLNVTERLRILEEKVVRYANDLMHFDHFIVRALDAKTKRLDPVIHAGLPPEALEVDLYAEPEGNGISGWVAATGRSYLCHDVEKDPRYITCLSHAKSSLTVPLRLHDKIIGVFNVESLTPHAFQEEDRQFAEIFARYIAMALNVLNLLVVERYTTTGRLAENVVREMAGPLNDIVTEAQTLIEEYIGNDDLRHRLHRIVDNAEQIRRGVRDVAQGPRTVIGAQEVKASADSIIGGKKILIADDETNIRTTIAEVLAKLGAQVVACKDGHEAAAAIESQPIDLIISDIRMPHRNGYEIFAVAQRVRTDLPVILMTGFGYDPNHSIVRASQEGLQGVLYKPFKVAQLLDEVRKALSLKPQPSAKR